MDDDARSVGEPQLPPSTAGAAAAAAATAASCSCCDTVRRQLELCRRQLDDERRRWMTEKTSVVSYQKLLQSAYLELVQRCADLEEAAAATEASDDRAGTVRGRWFSTPLEERTEEDDPEGQAGNATTGHRYC
jgi:hypothetical protein